MAATCELLAGKCGVLAVGRCHQCGKAFCQSHQSRTGYATYVDRCIDCQSAEAAAKYQAIEDRSSAAREQTKGIVDPTERLVRTVARVCLERDTGAYTEGGGEVIAAARPDLWPSGQLGMNDLNDSPPWNDAEIAAWFARQALEKGLPTDATKPVASEQRGLFGGTKTVYREQPAWRVPSFVTVPHDARRDRAVYVFSDGSCFGRILAPHVMAMTRLLSLS